MNRVNLDTDRIIQTFRFEVPPGLKQVYQILPHTMRLFFRDFLCILLRITKRKTQTNQ
ncbi:hypothetical protein [Tannerella sp.]|uniref:hypothetical protein n=1 Tax=Tannerella sp. TaxID=2382127 RepID=UPI003FA23418